MSDDPVNWEASYRQACEDAEAFRAQVDAVRATLTALVQEMNERVDQTEDEATADEIDYWQDRLATVLKDWPLIDRGTQ